MVGKMRGMARMPQVIMAGQEACYQENTTPDGEYGSAGSDGHWWTSTESGGSSAFDWYMSYDTSVVGRQAYPKNFGFSIRCIKDAE